MRQRTVPYFVGREEELKSLHGFLSDGESVAISAVSGMGGIGKSELALQYLYRSQAAYPDGILWLDATSATFAEEIIGFGLGTLKLAVPEDLPPVQKVRSVWAHWQGTDPVLVVVDNINQPEDFTRVQEFLPYGYQRFRVLVTSRVKLAGLQELPLDLLPLDEVVELLERWAKISERKSWDWTAAENLCKRLGRLPLAVTLVGSYLGIDPNLSLAEITAQLEKKGLDTRCLDKPPDSSVAKRGVKAAFDLSWDALTPEVQRLACVLAMFACAPIEWRLVENTFIPADSELEEAPQFDRFDLTDWRQELRRYWLLQEATEGTGYQLHPLIWEYLRQKISTVLDEQIRRSMVKAIVTEAKTIEYKAPLADYKKVRLSIPHITEVAEAWTDTLADEDVITPCNRLARYYNAFDDDVQEEFWNSQNVELAKKRLRNNHADIATVLNNLALLYWSQRKYQKAEPLYLEALAIDQESLPQNHPQIAMHFNNLALLYESQGKYAEAEYLFIQSLGIDRESLPKNHPQLANHLHNLALMYKSQGKYEEAEHLYLEALAIGRESLPQNHPELATYLHNLALLYESQRKYGTSEPLKLEALAIARESLPQNHPQLVTHLHNLAQLYYVQGKYKKAKPFYLEAIAIARESLPKNHSNLAMCLNNLGQLYYAQGKYINTEPLLLEAIAIHQESLPKKHPNLATYFNNLAKFYESQEKYSESELLYIEALAIDRESLPKNHPDLAIHLNNLAELYREQGKYPEAEPLYPEALAILEESLGLDHPNTRLVRTNYEKFLEQKGANP